jgi:hypothetical protein
MKLLLSLGLSAILVLATSMTFGDDASTVYICVSKSSYAYHYDSSCRGLSRCKHEVRRVSVNDAVTKYGRKLCGYED